MDTVFQLVVISYNFNAMGGVEGRSGVVHLEYLFNMKA